MAFPCHSGRGTKDNKQEGLPLKMQGSLKIGDIFPSSHFFQVQAGAEFSVVESLKVSGHKLLFKALGRHDIISFLDADSPDNPKLYSSCHGIRTTRAVIGYRLCFNNYESPIITEWLAGAAIVGFVFLEVDKWLYTPEAGAQSGIEACITIAQTVRSLAAAKGIDVALYGGFGKSELYAVVRADQLEDIWTFTTACRNLTCGDCITDHGKEDKNLPVFAQTETIPGISYDNLSIIDGRITVSGIQGNSRAYITLKCPPGFENYIKDYFPSGADYTTDGLLGGCDVIIHTDKAISSAKLIADILNFRHDWENKTGAPITTITSLVDLSSDGNRVKVSLYSAQGYPTSAYIAPSLQSNAPRLANRITTFFHHLNSCNNNRSYHAVIAQIVSYSEYISQLLGEYQSEHESMSALHQYISESALLEAIETAEIGLAQRIDNHFDSLNFDQFILPFGDGIFSSLVALEYLINYVLTTWSNNTPEYTGKKGSEGFPAFSDSFGFQLRWGETIFLPIEAIYNPTSPAGSWRTLSHEISHAIYMRLEVEAIYKDYYDELKSVSFHSVYSRALGINAPFEDQMNELFAHWYDFYHFYNRDINGYLSSIWPSWLKLPIVHENFSEYFLRSFVIYLMHNMDALATACRSEATQMHNWLNVAWESHVGLIKALDLNIQEEYLTKIEAARSDIFDLFICHSPILNLFHFKFRNDEFRIQLNKDYAALDDDLKQLANGEVIVNNIDNPYLLVRRLIENKMGQTDFRTSLSLILSLKNRKWFYTATLDESVANNGA